MYKTEIRSTRIRKVSKPPTSSEWDLGLVRFYTVLRIYTIPTVGTEGAKLLFWKKQVAKGPDGISQEILSLFLLMSVCHIFVIELRCEMFRMRRQNAKFFYTSGRQ